MNYSRLIWVKEVVCVGHERLTMSETRTGEMNFLSSFVPSPLPLSASQLLMFFYSFKNIGVVKEVYFSVELVRHCIKTGISKRRCRNAIQM
jgi:hypothetical protein